MDYWMTVSDWRQEEEQRARRRHRERKQHVLPDPQADEGLVEADEA